MTRKRLISALLLTAAISFAAGSSGPAEAVPARPALPGCCKLAYGSISTHVLSIDSCYMRVWYGDFAHVPFAKIRYYGGSTCGSWKPSVVVDNGSGSAVYGLGRGTPTSGTDACGTYIEIQDTYPTTAYSMAMQVTKASASISINFASAYVNAYSPSAPC